jgi:hypothetical protein
MMKVGFIQGIFMRIIFVTFLDRTYPANAEAVEDSGALHLKNFLKLINETLGFY